MAGVQDRIVIVDRYNTIAPNTRIGFDPAADKARYHVSEGGIVVLPKGSEVPDVSCYQQ